MSGTDTAINTLVRQSYTYLSFVMEMARLYSRNPSKVICEKKAALLDPNMTECCDGYNDPRLVLRYPITTEDRTAISQSDAATSDSLALRDLTTLSVGALYSSATNDSLVLRDSASWPPLLEEGALAAVRNHSSACIASA